MPRFLALAGREKNPFQVINDELASKFDTWTVYVQSAYPWFLGF